MPDVTIRQTLEDKGMIKENTLNPRSMHGVTLAELMIAVGVIAVLGSIIYPVMSGYLTTARQGALRHNIESVRLAEEDYKLAKHAFVSGTYDPGDPDNVNGLKARLGWEPNNSQNRVTYVVTCGVVSTAPKCTIEGGIYITATDSDYPDQPECQSYGGASCP